MTTQKQIAKMLDAFRGNCDAFVEAANEIKNELQETLDDLEDKQGEHETDARAEKIEKLSDNINTLETAIDSAENLSGEVGEAFDAFNE